MTTRIVDAGKEHVEFLAWVSLAAARSHLPRGFWDFFIPDERERAVYMAQLAATDPPHPFHYSRFLVAEVARSLRYYRHLTVVVAELECMLVMAETWGIEVGRHGQPRDRPFPLGQTSGLPRVADRVVLVFGAFDEDALLEPFQAHTAGSP